MRVCKYLIAIVLGSVCLEMAAIPARHRQVDVIQPDGSIVKVLQYGDEWMHWATTLDGAAVVKGEDGTLCYATFDAEGRRYSSGVPVGSDAPAEVRSAAHRIPFESMRYNAAAKRMLLSDVWDDRPGLIRRINAMHPVTKASGTPIEKHGIIILAAFDDVPFTYTRSEFDEIINGSGNSTALAYFNDQFGGRYDFKFDIYGPVKLPKAQAYYGGNDSSGHDQKPEEMVIDACEKLRSSVDFTKYDDDGDGEIDNVFIFFSGKDEADDQTNNANCIWSHQWYVYSGARISRYYNGKLLNNYACTSELMLSFTTNTYRMASIGTFCHEYTHTFGVPDFYDANYEGTGGSADAWWLHFGLMCAANINNDGHTPPNYNAVERECLELGEPILIEPGNYTLEPIQNNGVFYKLPTDHPDEYYLVECRNQQGWDAYMSGTGMLIYHIDKSTRETGVDDNGRKCTAADRWNRLNRVNAWPDHQCADLVEANASIVGRSALLTYSAYPRVEKQAYWPYNTVTEFSANSSPAFSFWSGASSTCALTNIARSDNSDNVTFTVVGDVPVGSAPDVQNVSKLVFQDAVLLSWEASDAEYEDNGFIRIGKSGSSLTEFSTPAYAPGKFACQVEGLQPSTAYQVELFFKYNGVEGKVDKSSNFTTASYKSGSYPYIYLDSAARSSDGVITAGSKIPLRVRNAVGATSVKWYFDGVQVAVAGDCWYELSKSGVLKAEVTFEDGSKDVIVKKITVR